MTGRFDARAFWDGLDAEQQRTVGEMALLMFVAVDANTIGAPAEIRAQAGRWEHAHDEAERRLDALLPIADDFPEGPDLEAVGIRACRVCGCTDNSACEEGCEWVGEDLCSACQPVAA
jgi:hypothetical protein